MGNKETGGCLCGSYNYSFDRDTVMAMHHCHCKDCQKATGGGKTTIVVVPADAIESSGELKSYTVVGLQGKHVNRGFCAECGSQVQSTVDEAPAIRILKAGTLDDSSWVKPISSFWCETAAPWSPPDKDLPAFERNPPA